MWRDDDDESYDDSPLGRIYVDDDYQNHWERNEEIQDALFTAIQNHLDERKGFEREVQDELTEEIRDLKDTLLIATPSRLAIFLTPKIFGDGAEFLLDPWLALLEQRAIAKLLSPEQSFLGTNAPPQSGKSTYCGVFLPFWAAGFYPEKRQIKIAYSESLAAQAGKLLRDLVKLYGPPLFGIDVDPDNEKVTDWTIRGHMGGMLSAGLGGSITGRSGDFIQIDDLIQNMQAAGSKGTKDTVEREYYGTIRNRLQPGGFVLLSATRFAVDDLSGRLQEQQKEPGYNGDDWEWLKFDALATPERGDPLRFDDAWRDCLGRRKGEPLQTRFDKGRKLSEETPEQWQTSHFYTMKRAYGSNLAEWSAIYQQHPTSPQGGMFPEEKWRYYNPDPELRDLLPHFVSLRRVWDLAATEGGGDWTTGGLVGKTADGDFYVLGLERFQKAADNVQVEITAAIMVDGYHVPIMIEEEKGGSGKHNTAFFAKLLAPAYVKPAKPEGKKEDRARPYSNLQQTGHLFLPKSPDDAEIDWTPDWLQLFIDEHAAMMGDGRAGRHDDIIDVVAYAVNDMLEAGETELEDPNRFVAREGAMAAASDLGSDWYG